MMAGCVLVDGAAVFAAITGGAYRGNIHAFIVISSLISLQLTVKQ